MQIESSAHAQVAISFIPRLNRGFSLPLIQRCGGIEGFFSETDKALHAIYQELHISTDLFDRKKALQAAEKELEQIDKFGIRICSIENSFYPFLLQQCEDFPLVFYYKGDIRIEPQHKLLAIVGTRHASMRYQKKVESTIEELSQFNSQLLIVSGLAYGIDAAAHQGSLQSGLRTFAVLGHGLHMIYPAHHRKLAEQILEADGAWISEFPCTSKTHPGHFLQRNRIIAGLCHATLIAESAVKGGAMATAHFALSYNREVMAFPGRFDDKYSAGCNRLIKENAAALVDNSHDIAHILGLPEKQVTKTQESPTLFDWEEEPQTGKILRTLEEKGDTSIDELLQITSIPHGELSALLLQLELEGKILALPGKRYAHRNS